MDNKENPSEAEGAVLAAKEAPIPPKKPAKVTQEVFLTKWRDVLALEKDPVPKLRLMVRAGFLEEVNAGHA